MESDLIATIYNTALEPQAWGEVMKGIREALGSDEATIIFYDANCRSRNFAATAVADNSLTQKYLAEYIDIEVALIRKKLSSFQEAYVVDRDEWLRLSGDITYEELLGDAGNFDERARWSIELVSPLFYGGAVTSAMGVYGYEGSLPLNKEAKLFLQKLTPHISNTIRIYNHICAVSHRASGIYETLMYTHLGVFLLDGDCRVVFSNAEAARIIDQTSVISIGRFGRISLARTEDQNNLCKLLDALLKDGFRSPLFSGNPITMSVYANDKLHPVKLILIPLESRFESTLLKNDVKIAIFANDPERPITIPQSYLKNAYKLTEAECTVAQYVAHNYSLPDIASLRNTGIETVRWQIKMIMQKTATHSQAELIKLLAMLADDFTLSPVLSLNQAG